MKKDLSKSNDIAISVQNVSKTFRIPHEKITSSKGIVVNVLTELVGFVTINLLKPPALTFLRHGGF